MANILDYLSWRGDLSLAAEPFCDVDFLVLSRMSYIPFDGVVPAAFDAAPVPLDEVAEKVLRLVGEKGDGRTFRVKDDEALLRMLKGSRRFATMRLIGFANVFNPQNEEQFSAITAILPDGSCAIAFRGTDGTVTGWNEDFNMAFSEAVPAQLDAVKYLSQVAKYFPGNLLLGGHSKGGNLAVYSAAFCEEETQRRIRMVRNFDGPGFSEETLHKPGLQRILGVTRTYLPQSSVIGMLLEHAEDFTIVESRSVGIYQHNPYMWEISRNHFRSVETLTNSSQFIDATMTEWITSIPPERREKMINGIFQVLKDADAKMLRDVWNGKKTFAVMKAYGELDEETRAVLAEGLRMLKGALKTSVPALLDRLKLNVKGDFSLTELVTVLRGIT